LQRAIDRQLEFDPRTTERGFTIRISDYFVQCALPRLCARVRAEAPRSTLIVDYPPGNEPGSDNPGDIQIGVCMEDWGPRYRQQRLLTNRFAVVMRPDHPAAGQEMTLDLYLSLSHLIASSVGARIIDDKLARRGLSRRIAVTIPNLAAAVAILENTDLCALLPEQWIELYVEPGRLVTTAPPIADLGFTVDIIWRAQDDADAGQRWLRQLIIEEFALLFAASDWVAGDRPHRLGRTPAHAAD